MRPHTRLAAISVLVTCATVVAQDPPTPPGGFAVQQTADVLVTWSDGYRTRLDVFHPTAPAPATGWPGIAVMHANNQSRRNGRGLARDLAAAGYATFAFHAPGDGETGALNPGWTTPQTPERVLLDSAERFTHVEAQLDIIP